MNEVLDLRGLKETTAMIAHYEGRELQNRLRRGAYAGAKVFQGAIAEEALARHGSGEGNVPLSFMRVPAPHVSTHGGPGRGIQAYVRPKSPLFNILEVGAHRHMIAPNKSVTSRIGRRGGKPRKPFLAGYGGGFGFWTPGSRGRRESFFASGPVSHPGLAPRPILRIAFMSHLASAETSIASALFGTTPAGGGPL